MLTRRLALAASLVAGATPKLPGEAGWHEIQIVIASASNGPLPVPGDPQSLRLVRSGQRHADAFGGIQQRINQRAVLSHRAALVEELYAPHPSDRVIAAEERIAHVA